MGSGNMGAANVWRTTGRGTGAAVLLLDALKGFLAVWLTGRLLGDSTFWMSLAALAAMLGHVFPVFLGFQGGKAVATLFGCFAWLTPLPTAAAALIWITGTVLSRHSSVGSLLSAVTLPLGIWLILHPPMEMIATSILAAGLIVWRHSGNIGRLRAGTETKISLGKRR